MDKKTHKPQPKTGNKWGKARNILIAAAAVAITIITGNKVKINKKS